MRRGIIETLVQELSDALTDYLEERDPETVRARCIVLHLENALIDMGAPPRAQSAGQVLATTSSGLA